MALDGNALGAAITAIENDYNDVAIAEADIPAKRLEMNQRCMQAIIDHFKANAILTVPAAGLIAPGGGGGPVTGTAHGTITS